MVVCWKCAADHEEPTGLRCPRRSAAEARELRANKRKTEVDEVVEMAAKDVGDVDVVDIVLDEEERALTAELAEQESNRRKLRLKARIAQLKLQNEKLSADPPAAGEQVPAGPGGSQVLQTPAPKPPSEKDSKYSIARFIPKLEDIRKANFQELMFDVEQNI